MQSQDFAKMAFTKVLRLFLLPKSDLLNVLSGTSLTKSEPSTVT